MWFFKKAKKKGGSQTSKLRSTWRTDRVWSSEQKHRGVLAPKIMTHRQDGRLRERLCFGQTQKTRNHKSRSTWNRPRESIAREHYHWNQRELGLKNQKKKKGSTQWRTVKNEPQRIIQKYSKTEKASEDHYRWHLVSVQPVRTTTAGVTERLVSVHRALMCLFIWVWWRLLLISALGRIKGARAARGTESPNTVQTGWRNPISNGKINLIN